MSGAGVSNVAVIRPAAEPGEAAEAHRDDFDRDVYCVLGLPIDDVTTAEAVDHLSAAAKTGRPYLISTPNLNFLALSRTDPEFRSSVIASDLCLADGISLMLIAKLLGVPLRSRAAGSDLVDAMRMAKLEPPIRAFLVGGPEGAAERAALNINATPGGLTVVGILNPGFGSIEQLSGTHVIEQINGSGADFLLAALGAAKGQKWLMRNQRRLTVPIRSHLGAAINFQAGTVKRAPPGVRRLGLEWLWRIKEEPHLALRYWKDGLVLLRLSVSHVLPLLFNSLTDRSRDAANGMTATVTSAEPEGPTTVRIMGAAIRRNGDELRRVMRNAARPGRDVQIDLQHTSDVDPFFLGLVLVLAKVLGRLGGTVTLTKAEGRLRRKASWLGVDYLFA